MNRWIAATALSVTGVVVAVLAARSSGEAAPAIPPTAAQDLQPQTERFVVHEWGTFTGFAGSDGVHLPFTTNIGSDLPSFVVNRSQHKETPNFQERLLFVKWGGAVALQRMETPVVYFYSRQPREVKVRVDFPQGTLSEFYPPVKEMAPYFGAAPGEPRFLPPQKNQFAALRTIPGAIGARAFMEAGLGAYNATQSYLDWGRVQIIPHPTPEQAKLVPAVVDQKQHYDLARETDAALVQLKDVEGKPHAEKFLFYRGLGNFTLPITLVAQGHDRFEVRSSGSAPIAAAFLLNTTASGEVRFASVSDIAGTRGVQLPARRQSQSELSEAIVRSLTAEGLYEKEARAMVRTWQASWLAEPGTRLLYLVPRPVTDALLPLHIEPTPSESVRVLVGRIDILTPEDEASLQGIMNRVLTNGDSISDQEMRGLESLGRFQMPALEHVATMLKGKQNAGPAVRSMTDAMNVKRLKLLAEKKPA